jgi:hypothetical protein
MRAETARIVDTVDLEHPVAVGDEALLERRRPARVDQRLYQDLGRLQVVEDDGLKLVVAQHRGQRDLGAEALGVLGDDGRPADETRPRARAAR